MQIVVWAFSFGHCVVGLSLIYGFVLSLWYLQTLLVDENNCIRVYMNMHEIAILCKIILIDFSATQCHSTNKHILQYSCVDNEHEVTVHSDVWLFEYIHFMQQYTTLFGVIGYWIWKIENCNIGFNSRDCIWIIILTINCRISGPCRWTYKQQMHLLLYEISFYTENGIFVCQILFYDKLWYLKLEI